MTVVMQICAECHRVNYPPREVCRECLGDRLDSGPVSGMGRLLARSDLYVSADPFFQDRLPWSIGSVRLDIGATVIVHLGHAGLEPGQAIELTTELLDGQAMLFAHRLTSQ